MIKNKLLILVIGFYIFWIGVLPLLLTQAANVLCKNLSYNSNYKVEIESPKIYFSILPVAVLKASNVKLTSKSGDTSLCLSKPEIKVRLLPLFSARLHLNDINIEDLKLRLSLKDEVELDKDFFEKLETTKVKFDSFKVNNYEIILSQPEIKKPIVYKGHGFIFQKKNRYLKLAYNSELSITSKTSKTRVNLFIPKNNDLNKTIFDVEMDDFDISPLRAYFRHYLPKDLKELQGYVNIHANKGQLITELTDCAAIMEDSAKSVIFPQQMSIRSKFNIKKDVIFFENVDIKSEHISISFDGNIHNYWGKTKPTLDLNFRVNPTKVEDLVQMLPAFSVEEIDVYKLKKYKFYGDMIANFKIRGRLPEPELDGDIYIDNGILIKPIPNAFRGATIKLNLAGKQANFEVSVPAGGAERVFVKGCQELYNIKYADLTVKSTQYVDLHVAQEVVNPLHEILNFIIGPVPIMDIYGKGNIDIHVKGNRKNPHAWGVFNANDANVKFIDMPDLALANSEAILTFNDQIAVFKTKSGNVNGKPFGVSGVCDLFGKFDFDVFSDSQPTKYLYKALQNTTLIPEIKKMIPPLENVTGLVNLKLKVYGEVKNIEDLEFNKNAFAKGELTLKENGFSFRNIDITNTNGQIILDGKNLDIDIKAKSLESNLSFKAKVKDDVIDFIFSTPRLNPNTFISVDEIRTKQYLPFISLESKYKGSISKLEFEKLNLYANVLESGKNILKVQSGEIQVQNNKTSIKNLKGYIDKPQNVFQATLRIDNTFAEKPNFNGNIRLKAPQLVLLNDVLRMSLFPKEVQKFIEKFELLYGGVDLECKVINNNVNAQADLSGISFAYLPLDLPVNIINGALNVKNNTLKLNKINLLADKMPLLIDGEIKDIFAKKNFNLYINSKPQQDFIDKYINKKLIYPIKIKGDILYWARLKGVPENYELKTNINMSKDSSFYHFGATVGDIENSLILSLDSKITEGKKVKIKEFLYDKLIDSQSGKQTRLNMLKVSGGIDLLDNDVDFKDLRVKTNTPTDARIFNIIFRKPNIKQGQFTSDLRFNGKLSNPKILGDFHIFETNIPFFDTTMKNIELLFKEKTIDFSSKGEVIGNDITFTGVLKNKFSEPYRIEKAILYTKDLNLNQIVNMIKLSEVENVSTFESFEGFDLSSIAFENFKLKADNIQLRNIHATGFEADTKLTDSGLFEVDNFIFNIAQGSLNGRYKYNLKNNDMLLSLDAENINANDLALALFDLKNQIYGDMTGTINLSCNGDNFQACMGSLNGESRFNVKDGRMPKLGSLEYLLKAGNLVKGGFTGLSINSVIDIITPLKTGEFSEIFGDVKIRDGVAENIEITSRGKDLSLFLGGTYNFATSIAEMEVYGLLVRKISTILGPIGNMSINTLFNVIPGIDLTKDNSVLDKINKIPGIELSSKAYRKFVADIKGNINGEDYVTSFKWIN